MRSVFLVLSLLLLSAVASFSQSLPEAVKAVLAQRRAAGPQLSATTLPDSFVLTSSPAAPGKILQMDLDVRFRSVSTGGFVLVLHGLPPEFCKSSPIDITGGAAAPMESGRLWFRWSDNYGKIMQQNAMYSLVMIDSTNSLTVSVFGFNVDLYAKFSSGTGFPASKSGVVLSLYVRIPDNFPEGSYSLVPDKEGLVILKNPVADGTFVGSAVSIISPIVIQKEPEYHRADVNRDGSVNVFDLLELLKILGEGAK